MKKIFLFLILLFLVNFAFGQLADSAWPVFHGNLQHTGLSPYDTSNVDGTVKWAFESGGAIESSPVIDADGTIYFGSHDGYFYAINNNGELKWKIKIGTPLGKLAGYVESGGKAEDFSYDTNTSILSTPAIGKDGTVYVASRDQYLFAISLEGKEKWKFPIGVAFDSWSSPIIGKDGTIYMASARPKGGLYAINPDGTEKWYYSIEMGTSNSAAIGEDGTIYIAMPTDYKDNALIAINPDGTKKWEISIIFPESTPIISEDTIYIGTYTEEPTGAGLYAISIVEKKIKWHLDLETKEVMTTPAIVEDGTVYVGNIKGIFYAINPDGTKKWSFNTDKEVDSSAAIGADGTIYFGSNDGFFYALNPEGKKKWHYDAKSSFSSSPAIGADGTVYVGAWDKKLYAFGSSSEKKSQPENCKGCNDKTTNNTSKMTNYPANKCGNSLCEVGEEKYCDDDCDKIKQNLFKRIISWFIHLLRVDKIAGPDLENGGPGGCQTKTECQAYCSDPKNNEECTKFASPD